MSDDYLDFRPIEKIYAPLFDFLVDLLDIKSQTARQSLFKTPRWPFRITPQMMQDGHPSSREYAESQNNLKREKRKTAMRETKQSGFVVSVARLSDSLSSVPQVPLPTLNPGTEIPSNGSVAPVSQPPSTVPSEINAKALARLLPQTSCEHQQCQGFWELAGGTSSFESPINGPFQMTRTLISTKCSHWDSPKIVGINSLARDTPSYVEMADNGDKKKQAHNDPKNKGKDKDDDKQLTSGAGSGTLLEIMPPNTLRHPAVEDVMDQLGAGAIKQYTDQLGRNQLCVSTLVGVPAIFFKGDDGSCLTQVGDIAAGMQENDQRFSGMLLFNDNDVSGVVVLTDNKVFKDKDAKIRFKPLEDMDEEKEA
ncbi:hypothetical protein FOBRF1_009237 [Fusarium oxysporum]